MKKVGDYDTPAIL